MNTKPVDWADNLSPDALECACRAHWPSWDKMRPDIQHAWRVRMALALRAALTH